MIFLEFSKVSMRMKSQYIKVKCTFIKTKNNIDKVEIIYFINNTHTGTITDDVDNKNTEWSVVSMNAFPFIFKVHKGLGIKGYLLCHNFLFHFSFAVTCRRLSAIHFQKISTLCTFYDEKRCLFF